MTDTATSRYGARQQSQGSNTNTWGDDKLNEVLRLLDRGSKGYEAIAMTGSTTLSWSNYVATNSGQVSVLKLTGSLSSAANLVVPSVEWVWPIIWNTTGQTITVKTSAGTGVQIPTGRKASVFCDATDCYFASPNIIDSITLTNSRDLVDKNNLETALANSSGVATAGTLLVSATDTTAGYLGQKIAVAGDLALTVQNGGADEDSLITHTPYWNTPRSLSSTDSPITAVDRDVLLITTNAAITVNLPASGRVKIADISGTAATYNITLTPSGGDTVTFGTIDTNYFSGEYYRNGTNWALT